MSKKEWVHPDVIAKAKQVDLLTYLATCEPHELVQETRTQWCTKTHDSLKISNGFWNWCSVGIGGKNAVKFMEKVRNIPYPESAKIVAERMNMKTPVVIKIPEKTEEKHIILPRKLKKVDRVIEYLKSRGIDKEIISKCIEKNLIYEEEYYHNAVFVGYDEMGNARYAGCRATNGSNFKNDATGSSKSYSFRLESREKTDTIYIFEGAIDLLSFATFLKLYGRNWENKTMISLAGVYQPAKIIEESKVPIAIQKYLNKHTEIKKIVLCLDSDEAGRNASKALQIVLSSEYEVIDKPPKIGKDYNEYLCRILGIKTQENSKKNEKERTR